MPLTARWAAPLAAVLSLTASAEPLEAVLARLDKAAAEFRDLSAEFSRTSFTAVLNESTQETGRMWIRRTGTRSRQMRVEFEGANPRWLGFDGSQGQIYYPKIQTVQIFEMGKHRSLVDQFLLLGFGTAGRDMARGYNIKVAGETTVAGRKSARLFLTPKSAEVAQHVVSVELAVPEDAGYPMLQRFSLPGGDYVLVAYSAVRFNPNLPEAQFRLDLPKGIKREYPQK